MKGMLERKNQHRGRIDSTPSANMRWSKLRPKLLSTRRSSKAGAGAPTNSKPASLAVVDVHLEEKSQEAVCDVCAFRRRAHVIGCPRCGEGVPKVKPVGEGVPKVKPTPTASPPAKLIPPLRLQAIRATRPWQQLPRQQQHRRRWHPAIPPRTRPITTWPRVPETQAQAHLPRPQANIDDLLRSADASPRCARPSRTTLIYEQGGRHLAVASSSRWICKQGRGTAPRGARIPRGASRAPRPGG